eukprot:6006833-Ditylum_brightwellii.AAC.1
MIATNCDLQEMIKWDIIKRLKTFSVRLVGEATNANSKLRQSRQLTYGKAALYAKESIAAKHKPNISTAKEEIKFVVPMAMFTEE